MLAIHYINRPTIGVSYSVVEHMLVDVCRQLGVDVITPINNDDNETATRSWLHRRRMLIVSLRHILDDGDKWVTVHDSNHIFSATPI
jgi:hypothetical protein